ncbi:conserved membrane hypothetical protein [Candidatus Roizmanbacteria bacterium]|nr:conserved membrane hypothetical protein [Candidatus Roizmanbacteria bacterium]
MSKHFYSHLKKEFKDHLIDYLLLITAGIFFLILLNIFRGQQVVEFFILVSFAFFYIIWGVFHHISNETLHLKTVVEYILISFIVIFLLKIIILP